MLTIRSEILSTGNLQTPLTESILIPKNVMTVEGSSILSGGDGHPKLCKNVRKSAQQELTNPRTGRTDAEEVIKIMNYIIKSCVNPDNPFQEGAEQLKIRTRNREAYWKAPVNKIGPVKATPQKEQAVRMNWQKAESCFIICLCHKCARSQRFY